MERLKTAILSEKDFKTYNKLSYAIRDTNNAILTSLMDSINSSIDSGIYPIMYISEAEELLNNKTKLMITNIKQLYDRYKEIYEVNSQLTAIIKREDKKNNINLFDSINHSIKDKVEEEKTDDIISVTYSTYDGSEYKAIVEANTNLLLKDIKRVLNELNVFELEQINEETINKYFEDTLFAAQTYYKFSEYVRYIDFTSYNKDIKMVALYEKYKDILNRLKDIVTNRIKYINEHKAEWRKNGIVLNSDKAILHRLYDNKQYLFTKDEILDSIYNNEEEKEKSI